MMFLAGVIGANLVLWIHQSLLTHEIITIDHFALFEIFSTKLQKTIDLSDDSKASDNFKLAYGWRDYFNDILQPQAEKIAAKYKKPVFYKDRVVIGGDDHTSALEKRAFAIYLEELEKTIHEEDEK